MSSAADVWALVVATVVVVAPGGALLSALGVRRPLWWIGLTVPASVGVATITAMACAVLGVRYGPSTLGLATGLLAATGVLRRRRSESRVGGVDHEPKGGTESTAGATPVPGGADGRVRSRGRRWRRWPWSTGALLAAWRSTSERYGDRWPGAALVVAGVGLGMLVWTHGLGSMATVGQEHDLIVHGVLTAYIQESGQGAPWQLLPADLLTGRGVTFYPAGLHLLMAVTASLTGSTVVGINAVSAVVLGAGWTSGSAALAHVAARRARLDPALALVAAGTAAIVAAGLYRPTIALVQWGGTIPNAATLALTPALLAALLTLPPSPVTGRPARPLRRRTDPAFVPAPQPAIPTGADRTDGLLPPSAGEGPARRPLWSLRRRTDPALVPAPQPAIPTGADRMGGLPSSGAGEGVARRWVWFLHRRTDPEVVTAAQAAGSAGADQTDGLLWLPSSAGEGVARRRVWLLRRRSDLEVVAAARAASPAGADRRDGLDPRRATSVVERVLDTGTAVPQPEGRERHERASAGVDAPAAQGAGTLRRSVAGIAGAGVPGAGAWISAVRGGGGSDVVGAGVGLGVAVAGMVAIHPSAGVTVGVSALAWWAGEALGAEGRRRLVGSVVPLLVAGVVAAAVAAPVLLAMARVASHIGSFQPDIDPISAGDALDRTLRMTYNAGDPRQKLAASQVAAGGAAVAGAVVLVVTRRALGAVTAWLAWVAIVTAAWVRPGQGLPGKLTHVFYDAQVRVWSHASLFVPTLAGMGLAVVAVTVVAFAGERAGRKTSTGGPHRHDRARRRGWADRAGRASRTGWADRKGAAGWAGQVRRAGWMARTSRTGQADRKGRSGGLGGLDGSGKSGGLGGPEGSRAERRGRASWTGRARRRGWASWIGRVGRRGRASSTGGPHRPGRVRRAGLADSADMPSEVRAPGWGAVAVGGILALAYMVGPGYRYSRADVEALASRYARPEYTRVSTADRRAGAWLADRVAPGERVLNSANDGSTLLYVDRRVPIVNVASLGSAAEPASYRLLQGFNRYPVDADVRRMLRELDVRWVYVDMSAPTVSASGAPFAWAGRWLSVPRGLQGLDGLPGLERRYRSGSVSVYHLDPAAIAEPREPGTRPGEGLASP